MQPALPDITGQLGIFPTLDNTQNIKNNAFEYYAVTSAYAQEGSAWRSGYYKFLASRSNPIYDGETVQCPAISLLPQIKI